MSIGMIVTRRNTQIVAVYAVMVALMLGCDSPPQAVSVPGIDYVHMTEAGPLSIHVVTFDLTSDDLDVLATVGTGVNGSETVAQMVADLPSTLGTPIAAINGDYFEFMTEPRYRGTLQGMCLVDGELVAGPAAQTFWIDAQRRPHLGSVQAQFSLTWPDGSIVPFGLNCSTSDYKSEVRSADVVLYTPAFGPSTRTEGGREYVLEPVDTKSWLPLRANAVLQARVGQIRTAGDTPLQPGTMVVSVARKADARIPALAVGDVLTIATALTPNLEGARTAVSGDPLLLSGGQLRAGLDDGARHPRTAVGFAGTRLVFVVVDGRQPDLSVGMSRRELAELMQRLGCTDALNLDGGGSSTFWYGGRIVNSPSGRYPRPVGGALVLVRTARR